MFLSLQKSFSFAEAAKSDFFLPWIPANRQGLICIRSGPPRARMDSSLTEAPGRVLQATDTLQALGKVVRIPSVSLR